ncbi:MAG: hypothetical protein M1163_00045 [Candidatus Thermoplasmatota archaeon]|nr:hypothetical protein [Candidatus Thermoplasmatota archaeon]
MDIRILIDEMVKSMGYRTYPGYPEEYIWVDHGDGSGEVIMLLESSDLDKVREFHSSTVSFPGERFLFVLNDDPNKDILSYCKGHKITSVTRDETARLLGKALIDMQLSKKKQKRPVVREPRENKDFILVYLEEGNNPRYIRPVVSGEMVTNSIGLRSDLIFVPHHFFSYTMKVMEGDNLSVKEGNAMVNAVNGRVSKSINGYELLDTWPTTHRELELKWEPLSSMERGRRWISDSLETEVVEKSETDAFIIYSRNRVRPLEETIKVTFINTCYYPIYSSSALVMDGFTGEIKSITDYV